MCNLDVSRKTALIFRTTVVLCFLLSQNLYSQPSSEKNNDSDIRNYKEELFVRTDRDVYITGEEVWFKVYKLDGVTNTPSALSKVVYLELLDKNNFPLKQIKVKTDNSSGSSSFVIPDNINSGNYLIRAYTNWMKNFTSDMFFYKSISVINPFETVDHIKLPAGNVKTDSVKNQTPVSYITDEQGIPVGLASLATKDNKQIKYSILVNKSSYSPREQVKVEISATDIYGNPVESELSVSVSKSAVVNPSNLASFYTLKMKDDSQQRIAEAEYNAELEGHLITGYLRLKTTDEPLRHTDLSLAFVGKTARCQFSRTDENGKFNFVVKESGNNEIVIQPLSPDVIGYYIDIDQPFSSSFSKFIASPFYLDSSKLDALNKVIIGTQVHNIYEPFGQTHTAEQKPAIPDFYGDPENSIKMADYIELTSLREVVKEIIPNVYTLKQNGKYDFKLINKFRGQPFENKPLILIDGVPVYDFEKILSINSKEIERADIVNTRYFYSLNIFDGIVSFITKKGNLSVLEFDNSIFRQAYEGCQDQKDFYSPDYSKAEIKNSRIPDYRNTLCWKPDLHTGKDGKTELSFYTSDESSDFTIVVEGIMPDGTTGYSTASFPVK
jgi:hypothetical protein